MAAPGSLSTTDYAPKLTICSSRSTAGSPSALKRWTRRTQRRCWGSSNHKRDPEMPLGMQIVGRHEAELTCLQLAAAYDQVTGWVTRRANRRCCRGEACRNFQRHTARVSTRCNPPRAGSAIIFSVVVQRLTIRASRISSLAQLHFVGSIDGSGRVWRMLDLRRRYYWAQMAHRGIGRPFALDQKS
jgi:hypothetical protein